MLRNPDQREIGDAAAEEIQRTSQTRSFEESNEEQRQIIAALPHADDTAPHADDKDDDEIGNKALASDSTARASHVYAALNTDDETGIDVETPAAAKKKHFTVQPSKHYRALNLIDLNDVISLQDSAINFDKLSKAKQEQLMDFYKSLVDQSRDNHVPLSQQLTHIPSGLDKKTPMPFYAMPTEKQEELLNYYVNHYLIEHHFIMSQGFLGYVGEVFYLYWDLLARMTVFRKFFPNAPEDANKAINYTFMVPITMANITYWPPSEAREYMKNKMLYQKSFVAAIKEHKFKTLMFFLYAFGGGYVEIVDINDDLNDASWGKYLVEAFLIFAAIDYYTAFQFNDVIEMSKKYATMPSLLKRAFDYANGRDFADRVTDLFNGMHEAICVVERILRMGYGGFEAGKQQSGGSIAYGFAVGGVVGVATAPVAYAIRTYPLRAMYDLDRFPPEDVTKGIDNYRLKYPQYLLDSDDEFTVKHALQFLKGEFKLFLTPSLFLIAPGAVWATSYAVNAVDNGFAKAAVGTVVASGSLAALHFGLFLRNPALRKDLVYEASIVTKPAPGTVVPNKLNYAISGTINLCDQTSRVLTFGYVMSEMFPELFDLETTIGSNMLMTILFLDAFIAISAWLYQIDKSAEAFKGYSHRYFGKKIEKTDANTSLLDSRSNTPSNPFDEEKGAPHDVVPLLPANDERSDSGFSLSRCAIM
jgi:hypothetical protein